MYVGGILRRRGLRYHIPVVDCSRGGHVAELVNELEPAEGVPVTVHLGQQVVHRELRRLLKLALQHQALVGCHQHFKRTRFAVTPAVFAGLVDVKVVVRMFDYRHTKPTHAHAANQLLHQGGFS